MHRSPTRSGRSSGTDADAARINGDDVNGEERANYPADYAAAHGSFGLVPAAYSAG